MSDYEYRLTSIWIKIRELENKINLLKMDIRKLNEEIARVEEKLHEVGVYV